MANSPAGSELNVVECVKRTADLLGCEPSGSDKSFQFQLSLPSGRRQKVAEEYRAMVETYFRVIAEKAIEDGK